MQLKNDVLALAGAYKGELNTDVGAKGVYPSLKIDPIAVQVNTDGTDTHTLVITLLDLWPEGCGISITELYAVVSEDLDQYAAFLRAMIEQLKTRYKYTQTGVIQIDSFPYNLTEKQLYAVRIRAQLIKPSPGDCCHDDWFDLASLPKKRWDE